MTDVAPTNGPGSSAASLLFNPAPVGGPNAGFTSDFSSTSPDADTVQRLASSGDQGALQSYLKDHPQSLGTMEDALLRAGRFNDIHDLAQSGQAGGAASGAGAAGATGQSSGSSPTPVSADQIRQIMPNAGTQADAYVDALNSAMTSHQINSPEQRAAFLGQLSVESGDLQHTTENLNYSAQRLTQVWPGRFPTLAAAQPYAHNPEALADSVYANRLGNGDAASGDGWTYRGRGLMQVTGRDNYRAAGFENNPEALAEPQTAANSAAAFWQDHGLNGQTDSALNRTQFDAITATVNGGQQGSDARWAAYQRALTALQPQSPAQ